VGQVDISAHWWLGREVGIGEKVLMWLYRLPLWLGELRDYNTQAEFCAGILEHSLWARNRVGIGLSYRLASAGIFK
jgi:hypothetical protein